jgi:hypothetical protein
MATSPYPGKLCARSGMSVHSRRRSWVAHSYSSPARPGLVVTGDEACGRTETRRSGSHRVLVTGDQQRIRAHCDGVDLGGPAIARIARDYGYTLAELRKL